MKPSLPSGPKRLVFSSTAAVYGEPESVPIPGRRASQSHQCLRRVQADGRTNADLVQPDPRPALCLSALLQRGGRSRGPIGVIRGEAHEPESHLIPLILDVALGRRASINIYGDDYPTPDGTCIRDYIHVSDLADAHLLALSALETHDRLIFNLGNGQGFSVRQVIESARRITGHPIPAEVLPRRSGDPAVLVASSAKAIRELGWKPHYTQLDDIVRTAWIWHQKRYAK